MCNNISKPVETQCIRNKVTLPVTWGRQGDVLVDDDCQIDRIWSHQGDNSQGKPTKGYVN